MRGISRTGLPRFGWHPLYSVGTAPRPRSYSSKLDTFLDLRSSSFIALVFTMTSRMATEFDGKVDVPEKAIQKIDKNVLASG